MDNTDYILQDLGDGEGWDLLSGETGDAIEMGQRRSEIKAILENLPAERTVWLEHEIAAILGYEGFGGRKVTIAEALTKL